MYIHITGQCEMTISHMLQRGTRWAPRDKHRLHDTFIASYVLPRAYVLCDNLQSSALQHYTLFIGLDILCPAMRYTVMFDTVCATMLSPSSEG